MKNKTLIRLSKLLPMTCLLLIVFNKSIQAQQPVPKMWIPKYETEARTNWFKTRPYGNSKKDILNKKIGYSHLPYFRIPVNGFRSLIDTMNKVYGEDFAKLNLYLTSFDKTCPGPLSSPTTKNKQFVLVFAPAGEDNIDKGKYFIISPTDNKCHEIPFAIKKCWALNYINNVVNGPSGLASTLDPDDSRNSADGPISDTRCITYIYSYFKQFINEERHYQDENGTTNPRRISISHIQVSFASYTITGIGRNDYRYPETSCRDRLILLFDFVRNGSVFYIDTAPDFPDRYKKTIAEKGTAGFDNGQLCPPNCPNGK